MVEVFKTSVIDALEAQNIIDQIHKNFDHYQANFALDDCDKILRINCLKGCVDTTEIIHLVANCGFVASVLVDDFQPSASLLARNTQQNLIF